MWRGRLRRQRNSEGCMRHFDGTAPETAVDSKLSWISPIFCDFPAEYLKKFQRLRKFIFHFINEEIKLSLLWLLHAPSWNVFGHRQCFDPHDITSPCHVWNLNVLTFSRQNALSPITSNNFFSSVLVFKFHLVFRSINRARWRLTRLVCHLEKLTTEFIKHEKGSKKKCRENRFRLRFHHAQFQFSRRTNFHPRFPPQLPPFVWIKMYFPESCWCG